MSELEPHIRQLDEAMTAHDHGMERVEQGFDQILDAERAHDEEVSEFERATGDAIIEYVEAGHADQRAARNFFYGLAVAAAGSSVGITIYNGLIEAQRHFSRPDKGALISSGLVGAIFGVLGLAAHEGDKPPQEG